ncbi:MAG: ABC transporter permease [Rhodospirillaceae bacterium]|jgi:ABC-type nitrate/sulfonate/bicarbonate transport system permease component|nr:ABC transporter permease [Rhodospirillaceae bacterium]MBT5459865.1 ABC transporter permease [Rhodospirillaceae bacterium]
MNAVADVLWIPLQRRFGRQRLRRIFLGAIPFVALLSLWVMNSAFGWLPPVFIPDMASVIEAIFTLQEDCPDIGSALVMHNDCLMTNHIFSSVGRVGLAALIGLPLGIAFGILAGMNRTVSAFLEPVGVFANSISGIAWIPLAIVWFGVGWLTTLFIMLNTIFWLLFFNAMLGVRSVSRVYEQSVLTMGGNRWHLIFQVYLPGAMPSIIAGIRMSMGFGWRALIAAEMIGGDSGLGFMIFTSAQEFKIEEVFLGVIMISLIWVSTDRYLLVPLEKWTIHRWGMVWRPD